MSGEAEEVVADDTKPELSIREELEAARDEVVARQENEHGDGNESVRTVERDVGGRKSDSAAIRTRDPSGKFAKADGAAQEGSGVDGSVQSGAQPSVSGTISSGQQAGLQQSVALPAPTSWKAEEKALWAKLTPDVQQILQRREQDIHRTISAQDEVRLVGNQFMQTANEYAPVLQARGITPVAFFKEALGIVSQLGHPDPAVRGNMLRQLAHINNVDVRFLSGQQPGAQGQPQPSNVPIDQLVQRAVNEQFQARQRQEAEQRERAEMQSVNSEIEVFRSKTDANGQPAYPYFDHVNSLMAAILGGGSATTLEEAYQLAVKAHPETSQLIAQAETAKAQEAEKKRQAAVAARRKTGSIRSGPGGSPSANGSARTIRDELKAAFEEARSRV